MSQGIASLHRILKDKTRQKILLLLDERGNVISITSANGKCKTIQEAKISLELGMYYKSWGWELNPWSPQPGGGAPTAFFLQVYRGIMARNGSGCISTVP